MVFEKIDSFKINSTIPFDVYQSKESKLRVMIGAVGGPLVKAFFSFVTETDTDDGLPHTLEHMIFMGCEKYKGPMDAISNRCLSNKNAETCQTHTLYKLSSACKTGFIKMLPVYMDYLLHPMLTQSQFTTEVHHVDGKGNDNGAIYNEIRDGFTRFRIIDNERKKQFYPEGFKGYVVDYGGHLKNLRETCSLEEVVEYHRKFYHLNNLFITVCGIVDHENVLREIEKIEAKYIDRRNPMEFKRPFQQILPELQQKSSKMVYPSEFDDKFGQVQFSWRGPPLTDISKCKALSVLMDYLSDVSAKKSKMYDGPVDELPKAFTMNQINWEIVAEYYAFPIHKMDKDHEKLLLNSILDYKNEIDVQKIGQIIEKHKRNFVLDLEQKADILIKDCVVNHQLFDIDGKQLKERLNEMELLNTLKEQNSEFWCELFNEIFTEQYICLMAEPSREEYEKLKKMEKQRINERKELLGVHGLKAKEEELKAAMEENEGNKIEEDLLDELIVNNEEFRLHKVETTQNWMPNLPFYSVLHKIPSEIFQVTIILDTHSMTNEERNLLLLWSKLIFQIQAIVDEKLLKPEEVQELSNRELFSKEISIGISGSYESFIFLNLRAYNENFKMLAKWTKIYMQNILFTNQIHQILLKCQDLEADIGCANKDSYRMANFLTLSSTYTKNSNKLLSNYLTQKQFLEKISMKLWGSANDAKKVRQKLEEVNEKVASLNVNLHFAGDPTKLSEKDWLNLQEWDFLGFAGNNVKFEYHPDYDQNWDLMGKMRAIGTESSKCVFIQIAKFEGTWKNAILSEGKTMEALIMEKYFCQTGGQLWNAMRGDGFSYKTPSIVFLPDQKSVWLTVEGYNLDKCIEIYAKTKETVLKILDMGQLDKKLFEEAKRSLIYELIDDESTLEMAAYSAMMATIRDVGANFTQKLCDRIWTAKMEDVFEKGAPMIRQLFDDTKSIRCIALNKFDIGKLKKRFGQVEFCRLKDLQTKSAFLNEIDDEEEINDLEDFQMLSEFFNEQ